ncbi:GNAT family N-acetyltransferase [Tropicimonas sp. S265A]|uniref:GNAT family N-acetyltransferase n=1 Tax=Tropicimonas sp. S265A TaxID=3415134 RepID=UPI003C7C8292
MPWRTQTCSADLKIRPARPRDHAALTALWRRAVSASHRYLGARRLVEEETAVSTVYLPACEVWIAEADGPVGFLALRPGGEVAGLFVDPVAQRKGVGWSLLDHVQAGATLHLEVAAPNFAARAFYAHYGFREVSRRHDPDLDEELLHMRLSSPGPEVSTDG